jgi:hypothetical protein
MPLGLLARVSDEFLFNMRRRRRPVLRSEGIAALQAHEPLPVPSAPRHADGPQLHYVLLTIGRPQARMRAWLRYRSAPAEG